MTIPLFGNELRIKYKKQLRFVEDKREVPVMIIGALVIAYWPKAIIAREAARRYPS